MTDSNPSSQRFLLQDSRGNTGDNLMFWAQAGGYTSNMALAERFDEEAAFRQHDSRNSDVPWPVGYLEQHTQRVVDVQYVLATEARACSDQELFYMQSRAHGFVGNDLVFLARDGKSFTIDLDQAKVFARDEVPSQLPANGSDIFWPTSYIDSKSRMTASSRKCRIADALKATDRKLVAPKRVAQERYKCHSCHIFLKASAYYGDCPRCGADNRP